MRNEKTAGFPKAPLIVALCLGIFLCLCLAASTLGPKPERVRAEGQAFRSLGATMERRPVMMPPPPMDQDPEEMMEALVESFLYNFGFSGDLLDTAPATKGQIKIACVGDSITYGYGVMDWTQNNYPTVLQGLLGSKYHVQNFGVSGRCVQLTADRAYATLKVYTSSVEYDADILVFMMGSNDSKPQNWTDRETFKAALCKLLDSYGKREVILCTPAYCFLEGSAGGMQEGYDLQPEVITEIAEVVREVAAERKYTLVDIYALTAENPQWYQMDGVHPNIEGAAGIADAIYDAVKFVEHKAVRQQGVN